MISRLRRAISRQLSQPAGTGGRVIAALMNRGNRRLNQRAIELLDPDASSRVLDLGFGGGLTLPVLLDRAARVVAIDRARDMVDAASSRHAEAIAAGRLTVLAGDITALPLSDASIDRVLTVNTVYFWPDLSAAFGELARVLAPGGRVVIGIRDGSVMERVDLSIFTIRTTDEIAQELRETGFHGVGITSTPDGATHLLSATKPG